MIGSMTKAFTAHPSTVGESYVEHQAFAARMGFKLLGAGLAALIHALLPFLFETTASRTIKDMNDVIRQRAAGRR